GSDLRSCIIEAGPPGAGSSRSRATIRSPTRGGRSPGRDQRPTYAAPEETPGRDRQDTVSKRQTPPDFLGEQNPYRCVIGITNGLHQKEGAPGRTALFSV